MNHGSFNNLVLQTIEKWYATRYVEKHGLVTSYDPDKHLGKVKLMPEGQVTGWLPIETGLIGQGYGIVIGLQPGQGGALSGSSAATFGGNTAGGTAGQPPSGNQGDQVCVRLHDGSLDSGKISMRIHSAQDKPPRCESGEIIIWTQFQKSGGPTPDAGSGGQGGTGQKTSYLKSGELTQTDGNGATVTLDGKGNIKGTVQEPGTNVTHQVTQGGSSGAGVGGSPVGGGGLGDIGSQLSGLIGQAGALSSAGVGLPGLNQIGSLILSLASTVKGAGSGFANQITSLGATMANGLTSLSSMSALVSSMTSQLSGLMSALNPSGLMSQVQHMHVLDQAKGIIASAFQGQHKTTWDQSGISHLSSAVVTSTAPKIVSNGNHFISDLLRVTKQITSGVGMLSPVFSVSSDVRLKSNIKPLRAVLDGVLRLDVCTFHRKNIICDENMKVSLSERGHDSLGLIAQDTQRVFPEIVRTDEVSGYLSIDSDKVAMLAIKAIQELAAKVERLERRDRSIP